LNGAFLENIFLPRNKRRIIFLKNRKKANKYSAKFQLLILAMGYLGLFKKFQSKVSE
jgi:hypothetical protein